MRERRINRNINNQDEEQVKPLLKIKPQFNFLIELASKYLGTLATIIFISILLAQTATVDVMYLIILVAIYVLYITIRLLLIKRKYKKTVYLFFEDSLYIIEKFGRHEQTIIPYSDIVDILFYQNYAQRVIGMGRLGVKIASGKLFNNIIMLEAVPNLNKKIEKIKQILY